MSPIKSPVYILGERRGANTGSKYLAANFRAMSGESDRRPDFMHIVWALGIRHIHDFLWTGNHLVHTNAPNLEFPATGICHTEY